MALPSFTADGILPPGDHELTLEELRASYLVTGEGVSSDNWDAAWRGALVDNLDILAKQLWRVGVTAIYVDGSFAENKDHPNDIDGYFECDFYKLINGDLERELNLLDPHKVWTWDPAQRRPLKGHHKRELPMWHQYRIDLYPNYGQAALASSTGNLLTFPQAFRIARHNEQPKGIIRLRRER